VLIIGAGPGGLAAAMLLAAGGARVRVLERLPRVGGRTGAIERDGFRFDMGPTFFLYPPILEEIFAACGHSLAEEVTLTRLDPQYDLYFEDRGKVSATSDVDQMQQEMARLNSADAERLPQRSRRSSSAPSPDGVTCWRATRWRPSSTCGHGPAWTPTCAVISRIHASDWRFLFKANISA